jgi:hypothetical protein
MVYFWNWICRKNILHDLCLSSDINERKKAWDKRLEYRLLQRIEALISDTGAKCVLASLSFPCNDFRVDAPMPDLPDYFINICLDSDTFQARERAAITYSSSCT